MGLAHHVTVTGTVNVTVEDQSGVTFDNPERRYSFTVAVDEESGVLPEESDPVLASQTLAEEIFKDAVERYERDVIEGDFRPFDPQRFGVQAPAGPLDAVADPVDFAADWQITPSVESPIYTLGRDGQYRIVSVTVTNVSCEYDGLREPAGNYVVLGAVEAVRGAI